MRAQERERELSGQEFIIGEPRPGGAFRHQVFGRARPVHAAQRRGKAWIALAFEPGVVLPFGQTGRQSLQSQIDRLAQLIGMKPLGHRINWIDERQVFKPCRVDHAIGMHHLQMAVVERGGT